jgi:hypothetical protein
MNKRLQKVILLFCAINLCPDVCRSQTQAKRQRTTSSPTYNLQDVLSWLPADTETILGANGPLFLSGLGARSGDTDQGLSSDPLQAIKYLPLGLFGLGNGHLGELLGRKKVMLAVEGSRHFTAPSGFGEMLYEGCEIAVFAEEPAIRGDSFIKDAAGAAVGLERVGELTVAVFEEKLEEDAWTTFVVFPRPNVVIIATNMDYLRGVVTRMNGARVTRALPESLPEWKYVNRQARVWGLRHYDPTQSESDPSSPFGGRKAANLPDDGATGVAFYVGPSDRRSGTMTYLSRSKNARQMLQGYLDQASSEPTSLGTLTSRVHEQATGVFQCPIPLAPPETFGQFLFVLSAMLGHGVYL